MFRDAPRAKGRFGWLVERDAQIYMHGEGARDRTQTRVEYVNSSPNSCACLKRGRRRDRRFPSEMDAHTRANEGIGRWSNRHYWIKYRLSL